VEKLVERIEVVDLGQERGDGGGTGGRAALKGWPWPSRIGEHKGSGD